MKTMYRIHPDLGFHQSTKVTTAEAEAELLTEGWAEEMPADFVEGGAVGDSSAQAARASIAVTTTGDVSHG